MSEHDYRTMSGRRAMRLRPAGWDPFEERPCATCGGSRRITVVTRASEKVRACPHCKGQKHAGRVLVGEPLESPYDLILDYTT